MNRLTELFFCESDGVFTSADVALRLNGSDFARNGLIKRAMAGREILNIRRGLYCLAPRYQKKPVGVFSLAQRIYGPSYISMETALSYHGWIPEAVHACTCSSYGNSKEFKTPLGIYSYKRVPQRTLYSNVERCVWDNANVFFVASPAKALADYVYTHRLNWTDIDQAAGDLRIESENLASVTQLELSQLKDNYRSSRVKRFLTGWMKGINV